MKKIIAEEYTAYFGWSCILSFFSNFSVVIASGIYLFNYEVNNLCLAPVSLDQLNQYFKSGAVP